MAISRAKMNQQTVILNDLDMLLVVVRTGPSVGDPTGVNPAIARAYRIVAHQYGPTLELVPVCPIYKASDRELADLERYEEKKRSN